MKTDYTLATLVAGDRHRATAATPARARGGAVSVDGFPLAPDSVREVCMV